MRPTLELAGRPEIVGRSGTARRLALGGVRAGLIPFALLVPMFIYQRAGADRRGPGC